MVKLNELEIELGKNQVNVIEPSFKPEISDLKNYYSVDYWFNMAPIPEIIKKPLKLISKSFSKDQNIGIKAGNIFLVGKK